VNICAKKWNLPAFHCISYTIHFIAGLMLTTRERDLIIISANQAQVQGLVITETEIEIIAC
jgi:hypothetical protein